MRRAAVIAGTPVDTQMGVEYVEKMNRLSGGSHAVEPVYCPVAEDCDAQVKFQYATAEEKRAKMDEIFDAAMAQGIEDFFIYCNSLSGAFDFDSYAEEKGVRIYTPLQVYRDLGARYGRVGVVAANNLSAHGIEKNLMAANEDIYMVGSGNMAIVRAIEDGHTPAQIMQELGLEHLIRYMEACGCEAVILVCTHFPYLREELGKVCSIPIIDPADEMYARMTK